MIINLRELYYDRYCLLTRHCVGLIIQGMKLCNEKKERKKGRYDVVEVP